MENGRTSLGKLGEDVVCRHLEALGHMVLERNWRSGHLEVDIITRDAEGIHFVEVKSRTAPYAARPEANVTATKQTRLIAAAKRWLNSPARRTCGNDEIFFDVAAVVFDGQYVEIEYFPKAFIPIYT